MEEPKDFISWIGIVPDPRIVGMVTYPLGEILLVALVGTLCRMEDWDEIVYFAEEQVDWLRRLLGDRGGNLPGLGIAHPGPAEAVGNTHLDELGTSRSYRVVVEIAVTARRDHLVLHPTGIRKAVHLRRVEASDTSRRPQEKAGRRTRGGNAGLRSSEIGNNLARPSLNLPHIHAMLGRIAHGIRHLGRHDSPANPSGRPFGVNDGTNPKLLVNPGHVLSPLLDLRQLFPTLPDPNHLNKTPHDGKRQQNGSGARSFR